MKSEKVNDFSRLAIHSVTNKNWNLDEIISKYSERGVKGVSVWRNLIQKTDIHKAGDKIRNAGLEIVSLVRGGFFASSSQTARLKAIDENIRIIDEAAELGSPMIVLVCGSDPGQKLDVSIEQIKYGLHKILPYAESKKIKLAVEPLHPMYSADRSAISTIQKANEILEYFDNPWLGLALDVYHVWWDPDLKSGIYRAGEKLKLFAFHISDWLTPTIDMLNDRGIMGEGCIPIKQIREWMDDAGFTGFIEVEIFSNKHWSDDQDEYFNRILSAYLKYV